MNDGNGEDAARRGGRRFNFHDVSRRRTELSAARDETLANDRIIRDSEELYPLYQLRRIELEKRLLSVFLHIV